MFPSRLDNRPRISTRQYRLLKPVAAKVRFGFCQFQSDRIAGLRKFEALQRFLCREGEPMAGLGNIATPQRIVCSVRERFLHLHSLRGQKAGLSANCEFTDLPISRLRRKSAMTGRTAAS
jgi:hypothetical protein